MSVESADPVVVEVAERIATVTLNRPEARNALSPEMLAMLTSVFEECGSSPDVDVIVLTGADPAFCAGLDLKLLGAQSEKSGFLGSDEFFLDPLPAVAKPVIGAVNGATVTGGLEIALTCDFLVASERARFADTHARVGIMPAWGLTVRLPDAVGQRRAREMSTTGNFVDAATALAWGLVNHVVPHDELLPFCRQLAADIVSNDQPGVQEVLGTYQVQTAATTDDLRRIEVRRSRAWAKSGGASPAEIERRRVAIVERGRKQTR
jgi:enoyl-CoA hydratase